ncbi:IQ domain-containing protein E isoform X3 [Lepisosteus oculatus]|uniref:IQ domain-containing protein E isoform X3 n=1 Tax=Lepisosteus oculatus TaxID=7918 RepID=UPI00073FD021|nr:PREDICTED: IQ domain-containing protein E isoform X3 [Lepisosteus oculatus]
MSVEASEFLTDEELEDLGEDGISIATYASGSEKRTMKKKTSSKPPPSPKSPYFSSTSLRPKKAAVWRSLKGTGTMHLENPSARVPREFWLASVKTAGLSQPLKGDFDATLTRHSSSSNTPEYLKEALGMKKPKHARSSTNGYVPGTPDFREKEDMYDEIIELKKTLQAQKSETDIMKTKLRRLEEENGKKEKQIEQLLDPTKGSEYTRLLVDKKNDASAIMNGLKQKILKLEQQCREKDNALNKLQNDLKTTNIEEMKIAMETYYDEVQRLRILLANTEAAESRAEKKESQKQQKALNSTVLRLSKNIKQLQEENKSLKQDLERAMDNPSVSSTARGYSDWSKQRLIRRMSELEKKAEESGSNTPQVEVDSARATHVSTVATSSDIATQSVTETPKGSDFQQECIRLRGLVKKMREERADLQEQLTEKIAKIKLLESEKLEVIKDAERLKAVEKENACQELKEQMERLKEKIKKLESELEDERHFKEESVKSTKQGQRREPFNKEFGSQSRVNPEKDPENTLFLSPSNQVHRHQKRDEKQEEAARTIQKHWHSYKNRNGSKSEDASTDNISDQAAILIQSVLRGHLNREKQLADLKAAQINKPLSFENKSPHVNKKMSSHSLDNGDEQAVILLQSAFRGHLARCGQLDSSLLSERGTLSSTLRSTGPVPAPRRKPFVLKNLAAQGLEPAACSDDEEAKEGLGEVNGEGRGERWKAKESEEPSPPIKRLSLGKLNQHLTAAAPAQTSKGGDSDDSDDIIVSPSRPMR